MVGIGAENVVDAKLEVCVGEIRSAACGAVDIQRAGVSVDNLRGEKSRLKIHDVNLLGFRRRDGRLRVSERGVDCLLHQIFRDIPLGRQRIYRGLAAIPHHGAEEIQVCGRQWTAIDGDDRPTAGRVRGDGASVGVDNRAKSNLGNWRRQTRKIADRDRPSQDSALEHSAG
jgi:hypothetical protein